MADTEGTGEGFARATTETLLAIRANLLKGIDRVVEHLDSGTLHERGSKASTPAEAGCITLGLLRQIDKELRNREEQSP